MYTKIKILGKGAYGTTYLSKKTKDDDKLYVIKEMKLGTESLYLNSLKEKIFPLMTKFGNDNICHPNITCLVDSYTDVIINDKTKETINLINLVYEYVEGVDMSDWLRNKSVLSKISKADLFLLKLGIARDLVKAFNFLTKNGITHRDIKPSNIIITKQYTPFIIDFGVSCINELNSEKWKKVTTEREYFFLSCPKEPYLVGTPLYVAPELKIETQKPHFINYIVCDIYSLGITFSELFYDFKDIPKLDKLIQNMININPSKRISLDDTEKEINSLIEFLISK